MIDIRYHVYSIAAVFLALAIGMIIGTSMDGFSPASKSERKIIERYENAAKDLKVEIEKASYEASKSKEIIAKTENLISFTQPYFIADKLMWRNAALVVTSDNEKEIKSIRKSLEVAGIYISSITAINTEFDFQDSDNIKKVLIKCHIIPPEEDAEIINKFITVLSNTIEMGNHKDLTSIMEKAGVASFDGDYTKENKLIVLIGGSSKLLGIPNTFDKIFITQTKDSGAQIVGVEPSNAKFSYINAWAKAGISTVDNIDQSIGRMSLVYALMGEDGQYGIKPTADRLYPSAMEQN